MSHLKKAGIATGVLTLVVLAFFSGSHFISVARAQTELQTAQIDRAALEAELAKLEAEIKAKESELSSQRGQSTSISRDISILTTQISDAKLKIKSRDLTIKKLSGEIDHKENTIADLSEKLDREKESLGQMIRKTHEIDETPFVYVALGKNSVSDFYSDLDSFAILKRSISVSLAEVQQVRNQTEVEKKDLELKQDKEEDARHDLEAQRKVVEQSQAQQKQLLTISKGKEKDITKYISDTQKKAGEIKARLFTLAGGSQAIRFDMALGYAESAGVKTTIDPAFLLAILTQESNLGSNVGKCYISDTGSGAGFNVNSKATYTNVMKASRDLKPFIDITSRLGMDPLKTVVSCPIKGVGYGGAMGPAQFIPSTWQLFNARVAAINGGTPNPWDARDAFVASALYLTDLGAKGDSYSAQIRAACKYYGSGGSTCGYGRSVMNLKASIQKDIDYLKQYGVSKR